MAGRARYLSVKVVKGIKLAPKDSNGLSDPFVTAVFRRNGKEHDKKEKTSIVKKTLNPEWNETFSWPIVDDGALTDNDVVNLQCWDDDMMGKDFEGEVDIKLGGIGNSTVKANYPLRPRAGKKEEVAGELVVEITVAPTPLVPTKVGSSSVERDFIEPIWEGRATELYKSCHPKLFELVDEQVLIARMNLYKATLGHCLGSDGLNASKGVSYQGGHKLSTDEKALRFEHGKARVELQYLDGKLSGWTFDSTPVPDGLLVMNAAYLYANAKTFWEQMMNEDIKDEAIYASLPDELKAKLDQEEFGDKRLALHMPFTGKLLGLAHAPGVNTNAPVELKKGKSGSWEMLITMHLTQEVDFVVVNPDGKRTFPAEVCFAVSGWRMILIHFAATIPKSEPLDA